MVMNRRSGDRLNWYSVLVLCVLAAFWWGALEMAAQVREVLP